MHRPELLEQVQRELDGRRLVWFGTRGDDAEALTDLPALDAAFSLIARHDSRPSVRGRALEDITGVRSDLDTFDLDAHAREEAVSELRSEMYGALSRSSALFTYRPSAFASAIAFARQDRCLHLGLFDGLQAAFEHKPWVESAVARLGVPVIPWKYIADIDQLDTLQLLEDGPVMLRRSRSNGGVGLVRVDTPEELVSMWPEQDEAFVSVSPYIADGVPLNVSAVVWGDGTTVHPASVQLIGVPGLTERPFGYCGNDFGAVAALPDSTVDEVEATVRRIARWMREHGYRGAFGVDFIVHDGVPLFTEVNPRFQGSTHASCQWSIERDESCLLLEHLAAFLGLPAPKSAPLRKLADGTDLAHFVVHRSVAQSEHVDPAPFIAALGTLDGFCRADVTTDPVLLTEVGATIGRFTVRSRLTDDGFSIRPGPRAALDRALAASADPFAPQAAHPPWGIT